MTKSQAKDKIPVGIGEAKDALFRMAKLLSCFRKINIMNNERSHLLGSIIYSSTMWLLNMIMGVEISRSYLSLTALV